MPLAGSAQAFLSSVWKGRHLFKPFASVAAAVVVPRSSGLSPPAQDANGQDFQFGLGFGRPAAGDACLHLADEA